MKGITILMTLSALFFADVAFGQNVGIGTNAPTEKIHVVGGARITNLSGVGYRLVSSSPTGVLANVADGLAGQVLTTDGAGNYTWATATPPTVDNGLYYNGGAASIRMGGPLVEATTITHQTFTLTHNLNSTGDFNVQDNGTNVFQIRDDGIHFVGDDMYWRDGSTAGTNLMVLTDDVDDGRLRIYENGATAVDLDANTQFIFNEQGLDRNFRVESNGLQGMIFADAGLDRVGIGTMAPVARFHVFGGRAEVTNTNDATGTTGSGVLEIGNSLRIDGNEVITNTNTTLYLQNDNNGDLRVDANTLNVDASINVVGLSAMPAAPYVLGAGVPVHTVAYPVEIGSDGNAGQQVAIGYYRASDPEVNPEQTGGWGYVGYNVAAAGEYWWRMYSGGYIVASERDIKRNIHTVNQEEAMEDYLMATIKNMKPSVYNYNNEYDEMLPGLENHYRPAFRMGLIVDETPDFLLDEGFSGVDIYGVASLSLAGVQHNMKEIEELKEIRTIQDFGSSNLSGTEVWVDFTENFEGNIPVVTITSNNPNVTISVAEKTSEGFKAMVSSSAQGLQFDWIAMSKKKVSKNAGTPSLSTELKNKLEVPAATKQEIKNFYKDFNSTIEPAKK